MSFTARFAIVPALILLGSGATIFLASPASGQPCAQPGANCQLPDQGAHGAGFVFGAASDANPDVASPLGLEAVDNFVITGGGSITSICWWGMYVDFGAGADCNAAALPDAFTVRYYSNVEGFPPTPGTLKAGPFTQGDDLTVTRAATGNTISPTPVGDLTEFEYSATHPAVTVAAGECCWVSIQNDSTGSTCWWLWSTAPSADEVPPGTGDGTSYRFGSGSPVNDFDLAFCLNLPLGDQTACKPPINPGCVGATNPCDEVDFSGPGCVDPECCTMVCLEPGLELCCLTFWNQGCADVAAEICILEPPAPEPCPPLTAGNCQLPDLGGSGGLADHEFIGTVSDRAVSLVVADNFAAGETANITQACWWGFYSDGGSVPDCSAKNSDDFRVTYYHDDGNGLPQLPALASYDSGNGLVVARAAESAHQGDIGDPDDDLTVYKYNATHPSVGVVNGQCYWIEISNNLNGTCLWFWETAPDNGTGSDDFDYSLHDDATGYGPTDARDIELGWCLDIALGDVSACAPPNPQESCDPAGDLVLTQNTVPGTIVDFNATTCFVELPGGLDLYSTEASFARSYDLGAIAETSGQDIAVVCVPVAVQWNDGSAYPVTVNIYEDTNGGAPVHPNSDLNLLGSVQVYIPANTLLGFVEAQFEPPVEVPADTVMVVELDLPNRDPSPPTCDTDANCPLGNCIGDPNPGNGVPEGLCEPLSVGDSGGMWPGTNNLGESAPSYIRSGTCGAPNYLTMATIGAGHSQLLQEIHVNTASACPSDCQGTPNGFVDVPDFLAILSQWSQVGTSCDLGLGDPGVGINEFLQFLSNFGPCP
ncbi:MAG: DUF7901 domain-containing protein [Planctomycetota bacterium]|jgi:hypothetical protein